MLPKPSCFGKYHIALLALFLTVHFDVRRLAKRHFSSISSLSPVALLLASGVCVCVCGCQHACLCAELMASVVQGATHTKRGPVTHSERPYVCLRELNASGRGSRQKTLGEQWGVITQAPWLINRESGAPGPLESPVLMGGGSPLQMWGCNCIKAWQEEK